MRKWQINGKKDDLSDRQCMHVMDGIKSTHDGMAASASETFCKKRPRQFRFTNCTNKITNGSRLASCKRNYVIESMTDVR